MMLLHVAYDENFTCRAYNKVQIHDEVMEPSAVYPKYFYQLVY